MTETCYDFNSFNLQNVCRLCLATRELRPMFANEINWYQTVVNKMQNDISEYKLNICIICGYLLRKYINFCNHCQEIQSLIRGVATRQINLETGLIAKQVHNFVKTKPEIHLFGPENDIIHGDTNNECIFDSNISFDDGCLSDREDDMPLVMLQVGDNENMDKVKKKHNKSKRRNLITSEVAEIKQEDASGELEEQAESRGKRRKPPREGFSSRMVQETDEYIVIKLTEQQVLEEMREHEKSEKYQRALYKCTRCVQGFNFEDVLRAHMQKHTQENGSFLCSMCSQYCPSAVSLRGHIKSHTTRYKCKICGVVRRGRQHLLEHHALAHSPHAHQYACHHCQFTTNKRTVIQRHVRSHRSAERHACEQCGRLFRTVESLRVHATRHDKSRAVRCGECGRSFLYPSLLARHTHTVHLRAEYYCVECDVTFKSPDNLRLHFKKAKRHRDSSSYTFECEQCAERFVSAASLAVHSTAAHGQPKRHACTLCRRLYSTRESLRAHYRRAHRNDQPGT